MAGVVMSYLFVGGIVNSVKYIHLHSPYAVGIAAYIPFVAVAASVAVAVVGIFAT
jgi:hypothetical protein